MFRIICSPQCVFVFVLSGELALAGHCGAGPAVDAQVCATRLDAALLPHPLWDQCLEEALRGDREDATMHCGTPG